MLRPCGVCIGIDRWGGVHHGTRRYGRMLRRSRHRIPFACGWELGRLGQLFVHLLVRVFSFSLVRWDEMNEVWG